MLDNTHYSERGRAEDTNSHEFRHRDGNFRLWPGFNVKMGSADGGGSEGHHKQHSFPDDEPKHLLETPCQDACRATAPVRSREPLMGSRGTAGWHTWQAPLSFPWPFSSSRLESRSSSIPPPHSNMPKLRRHKGIVLS